MDDFLEQVAIRRHQGVYTLLYMLCWAVVIIFGLYALLCLTSIVGVNPETGGVAFDFVSLGVGVVCGAIAYFVWRASDRCRVEYDYTFTNGVLDVSRVMNNKRRKYLTSLEMKDVVRCGPASGQAFMKTLNEPGIKRHNWFVNREANLYFFYFIKKGIKHVIVLELSNEMVALIRGRKYLQHGVWYEADGRQIYGNSIS